MRVSFLFSYKIYDDDDDEYSAAELSPLPPFCTGGRDVCCCSLLLLGVWLLACGVFLCLSIIVVDVNVLMPVYLELHFIRSPVLLL
jgi:hypothetical protein